MPLNTSWNTMKMLLSLARTKDIPHPIISDLPPQKPGVNHDDVSSKLKRALPEEMGVPSAYIKSFFNEVENDDTVFMNRAMIIKGNKVIAEKYYFPYRKETWNSSFSLTKTTIGLAIGFLYDEGKIDLDEKIYKILCPKEILLNVQNRELTIRHLLTMTTGVKFNEASSAVSKTWVKDFLNSSNKFKPGTAFEYNSLNTYMLSAIVTKLSGESLTTYLKKKLYDPLDIKDFYYETSPEGIEKGGWGLYITPEDMAKLGILVRDYGKWDGKQIISEEWIKMMSTTEVDVKMKGQDYDYGFQMWTKDERNVCCFNGLFDQDIVIMRNSGIVFVCCCANNDAFHTSNVFKITEKYFDNPVPEKFKEVQGFGWKDTANDETLMHYYSRINKNYFQVIDKKAVSVSVLPLVLQASMNTYTSGLSGFSFKKDGDVYILHVDQVNEDYNILYNFTDGIDQIISFYGNKYECNVSGRFLRDEEMNPLLLIRIYFLEFASVRYIKFYFLKDKNEMNVRLSENPGTKFLFVLLSYCDKRTERLLNDAMNIVDVDYVLTKLNGVMNPTFNVKKTHISELLDDEKTFLSAPKNENSDINKN